MSYFCLFCIVFFSVLPYYIKIPHIHSTTKRLADSKFSTEASHRYSARTNVFGKVNKTQGLRSSHSARGVGASNLLDFIAHANMIHLIWSRRLQSLLCGRRMCRSIAG